jgi:diaminopimelate epimerase
MVCTINVEGVEFYKMSGTGNDFIVIDNRDDKISENHKSEFAASVCKRRLSIGADGILLVENSDKADFKMRYFNADGSEGSMCGNGARCIARYAALKRICETVMKIETLSGTIEAQVEGNYVGIRMNPVTKRVLNKTIDVDGEEIEVQYIELGTPGLPHTVVFERNLTKEEGIEELGRKIRFHEDFPGGTNVNFCNVLGKSRILNRTFERGVEGETLACGTGAVAAACAAFLLRKCSNKVTTETKGGILNVAILDENLQTIFLKGDAHIIYEAAFTGETISRTVGRHEQ